MATLGVHAQAPAVHFSLTLLHHNDGESKLVDAGAGLHDFGGVARFAALVARLRQEAGGGAGRGVVLVSARDSFLAGPQFQASLDRGVPYYDTIAMDVIGYDAVAVGNHEFDFGPDVLAAFIEGFTAPPPFVSANLRFAGEPRLQALADAGRLVRSVVVRKGGERIGIHPQQHGHRARTRERAGHLRRAAVPELPGRGAGGSSRSVQGATRERGLAGRGD